MMIHKKYIVTIVVKHKPGFIGDRRYEGKRVRADVPAFDDAEAALQYANKLPAEQEALVEERLFR